MKAFKRIIYYILHPSTFFTVVFAIMGFGLLIYVFAKQEEGIIAYISYAMSAYALLLISLKIPALIRYIKTQLKQKPYTNRYINDKEFRARVSLYGGLTINLLYSFFKIGTGIIFHSVWDGAMAGYYIVLSVIRFVLVKSDRQALREENTEGNYITALRRYRLTGILMLVLNIAMSAMIIQMLWQNKSVSYTGTIIYASATYTFYIVVISIVNLVKYYKLHNPILSAAKMLNFAVALMSLFSLQTTMILEFGNDEDFRQIMNSLSGAGVLIIVFGMAIYMIMRSNKELKNISARGINHGKQR